MSSPKWLVERLLSRPVSGTWPAVVGERVNRGRLEEPGPPRPDQGGRALRAGPDRGTQKPQKRLGRRRVREVEVDRDRVFVVDGTQDPVGQHAGLGPSRGEAVE